MKKVLLFSAAGLIGLSANAQQALRHGKVSSKIHVNAMSHTASKSTAAGDTVVFSNIGMEDTLSFYVYDDTSGNFGPQTGTNSFGDQAFAERYNYTNVDSSVRVIGTVAYFVGKVSPTSTNSLDLKVWNQGPKQNANTFSSPNIYVDGYPGAELASQNVLLTGITLDNATPYFFNTPSPALTDTFFVGYHITYDAANLNGDTLGLVTTQFDDREGPYYLANSSTDTTIIVANAVQWNTGEWAEELNENSFSAYNYVILPIMEVLSVNQNPTAISGITQKDLTFYGTFPNPAANTATVKLALKNTASVTVRVMDMTGRTISTLEQGKLAAGTQTIPVNTAALAAGSYIFAITTDKGEGIGCKVTVAH